MLEQQSKIDNEILDFINTEKNINYVNSNNIKPKESGLRKKEDFNNDESKAANTQ